MPGAFTSVTLPPGTYEVRYWACADVGETANIRAHLGGRDLDEKTVSDDWKQFTQTVEIKERLVKASLRLMLLTFRRRVWFDDMEVEAVR